MFSKLRRNKSDKLSEPRKLSGMPALKQKRSSMRAQTPTTPTISDFDRQPSDGWVMRCSGSQSEQERNDMRQPLNITRNYKRPTSANGEEFRDSRQDVQNHAHVNNIDRLRDMTIEQRESIMFYDDVLKEIEEEDEANVELEEPTTPTTSWRISKGDSGYKSKDEAKPSNDKGKMKSRRKYNESRQRGHGLHTIKQQRKASREESLSQSMRALTPKERESIRYLEEVLKNHKEIDESFDEVFDSDSSLTDANEITRPCSEISEANNEEGETNDFGNTSENNCGRRYSLESTSSVGSIIDLVGNLSSASNPNSPIYVPKGKAQSSAHITESEEFIYTEFNGFGSSGRAEFQDCDIGQPEEITHLDNVILSFSCNMDDASTLGYDGSERRSERKREKKSKRSERKSHSSDKFEAAGKQNGSIVKEHGRRSTREKEDNHISEESIERRKRRKEKKRAKGERNTGDKKESTPYGVARDAKEEKSSSRRHAARSLNLDTLEPEPIYAQVRKPNKEKHTRSLSHETEDKTSKVEDDFPDPPSPFKNCFRTGGNFPEQTSPNKVDQPTGQSSRNFWTELEKKQTQVPVSVTSPTPRSSSQKSYPPSHYERVQGKTPNFTRPVSDAPEMKYRPQALGVPTTGRRLHLSDSVLQNSAQDLRHVKRSPGSKVFHVDPDRNRIEEEVIEERYVGMENSRKSPGGIISPQPVPLKTLQPAGATHDVNQNPVPLRKNNRIARPISLNIDQSGNLSSVKSGGMVIKPYSSFREGRNDLAQNKPRPFVITPLKKQVQLF